MAAPQIFVEAADMRTFVRDQRRNGKTIGFVPTMVGLPRRVDESTSTVVAFISLNSLKLLHFPGLSS